MPTDILGDRSLLSAFCDPVCFASFMLCFSCCSWINDVLFRDLAPDHMCSTEAKKQEGDEAASEPTASTMNGLSAVGIHGSGTLLLCFACMGSNGVHTNQIHIVRELDTRKQSNVRTLLSSGRDTRQWSAEGMQTAGRHAAMSTADHNVKALSPLCWMSSFEAGL